MTINKEKVISGLKFVGTVVIPALTLIIDATLKYMGESKAK